MSAADIVERRTEDRRAAHYLAQATIANLATERDALRAVLSVIAADSKEIAATLAEIPYTTI